MGASKVPRCWRCERPLPHIKGKLDGFYQLSTLICIRCRRKLRKQGLHI